MELHKSSFQYEPLRDQEIRLLHLSPGWPGDELAGDLVIKNLDDKDLKYDALSYMWGDTAPVASIHFGSQNLPIAANLMNALQRLRYPDKMLYIWVDAICINQRDFDERAAQVPLMRRLYRGATVVRSWVHVSLDTSSEDVQALQGKPPMYPTGIDPAHNPTFWHSVAPLFSDPYWSRAWVQQEVINAKDLVINCLNADFEIENIKEFLLSTERKLQEIYIENPAMADLWSEHFGKYSRYALELCRHRIVYDPHYQLLEILGMFSKVKMTRQCDYLYALMHLANDYEEGAIQVDYSKNRMEVVIDAVKYHLKCHRNVEFLGSAYCEDRFSPKRAYIRTSPSWISPGLLSSEFPITAGYRPCGSIWGHHQPSASISTATRRLKLLGMKIDRIYECLTPDVHSSDMTVGYIWRSRLSSVLFSESFYELMRTFFENTSGHWFSGTPEDGLANIQSIAEYIFDIPILWKGYLNSELSSRIYPHNTDNVTMQLCTFATTNVIQTDSGYLGAVPKCDSKVGDEVWIVLGCSFPIILRPNPDGTYWHSCPAIIPKWHNYKPFHDFRESSRPGDKIGDWVVEEIEIS